MIENLILPLVGERFRNDEKYRTGHISIVNPLPGRTVAGAHIPEMKALARSLACGEDALAVIKGFEAEAAKGRTALTHEELMVWGMMINCIRTGDRMAMLGKFVPYIDNWATCDITASAMTALGRNPESVMPHIERWLRATHAYTVRFGIVVLLGHYLGEGFEPRHLALVADVRSDEYYINMARAWYFSTALAKQYNAAMPYFTERRLDRWTHNKSLQKARESFRVGPDRKIRLQQLKY